MENERLGLLRAAVIVFMSGLLLTILQTVYPFAILLSMAGDLSGRGAIGWEVIVAFAVILTVDAIAVVIGVRMSGFRVSFVFTMFALGVSTAIAIAIGSITPQGTGVDSTGIAGPAIGVAWLPLGLLIGLLLPAFLIDGAARPRVELGSADPTYPPDLPFPPYPPYPPPEPRR